MRLAVDALERKAGSGVYDFHAGIVAVFQSRNNCRLPLTRWIVGVTLPAMRELKVLALVAVLSAVFATWHFHQLREEGPGRSAGREAPNLALFDASGASVH